MTVLITEHYEALYLQQTLGAIGVEQRTQLVAQRPDLAPEHAPGYGRLVQRRDAATRAQHSIELQHCQLALRSACTCMGTQAAHCSDLC